MVSYKKILIANENVEESERILKELSTYDNAFEIDIASSGKSAIDLIKSNSYDLMIIDLVLPEIDGFEVIEIAREVNRKMSIIVVSALSSDIFVKKATNMGVSYFMLKPISIEILLKRINDIFDERRSIEDRTVSNKEIEEKITNIFITVGIPAHIKGYQFLREAIKLSMTNPEIINSITKKLYPTIAEKFDTSASKVERAIRHAIEVAWNRGKIENINSVFGLTVYSNNEKPTNGEFIALVADKMLLDV
jgi:two-component system response regulator (stage 0 sporulation protein A)